MSKHFSSSKEVWYNVYSYPFVSQVKIFPFMFHVDMFVCVFLISAAYIHFRVSFDEEDFVMTCFLKVYAFSLVNCCNL